MSNSKTLAQIGEASDRLSERKGKINGHHTVDYLAGLYEGLGELKKRARSVRKEAKAELLDRAENAELENEKGQPILEDEEFSVKAYARASTELDDSEIREAIADEADSKKEAIEMAFDLCGGPNVGKTKSAVKDDLIDENAVDRDEPTPAEHREEPSSLSIVVGKHEDALPA